MEGRLTRRQALGAAGAAGAAYIASGGFGGVLARLGASPAAAAAAACATVTPSMTEGPYWVDEMLRRADVPRQHRLGVEQRGRGPGRRPAGCATKILVQDGDRGCVPPSSTARTSTPHHGGGLCVQRPATIVATTLRVEVFPGVAVEDDEVGRVARQQLPAPALVARAPRRRDARRRERLVDRERLLRMPPSRRTPARMPARGSSSSTGASEPLATTAPESRSERYAYAPAVLPGPEALRELAVRGRVRELHGAGDAELGEARQSSGARSCACSIRCRSPRGAHASRVASNASSAFRFARSPIACTATGRHLRARAGRSAQLRALVISTPPPPSISAVREPSVPSMNTFR